MASTTRQPEQLTPATPYTVPCCHNPPKHHLSTSTLQDNNTSSPRQNSAPPGPQQPQYLNTVGHPHQFTNKTSSPYTNTRLYQGPQQHLATSTFHVVDNGTCKKLLLPAITIARGAMFFCPTSPMLLTMLRTNQNTQNQSHASTSNLYNLTMLRTNTKAMPHLKPLNLKPGTFFLQECITS